MKQVIVMRALPGAGKSTRISRDFPEAHVVSADNFFMQGVGVDRKYVFDPSKIGDAHANCFWKFIQELQSGYHTVIVDNTNTREAEIAPYMLGAAAFGYRAKVVTLQCDPKVAAARNVHGVPEEVVLKMAELLDKPLPPWWEHEVW